MIQIKNYQIFSKWVKTRIKCLNLVFSNQIQPKLVYKWFNLVFIHFDLHKLLKIEIKLYKMKNTYIILDNP